MIMLFRANLLAAMLVAFGFCSARGVAAAKVRAAIVVGNNAGMSDEVELRYAESDALKIGKVLTDLGGFEPTQVHVLTGRPQDDLRQLFREVSSTLSSTDDGTGDGALLFFYFSGHSDGRYLHMSGSKLPIRELQGLLDIAKARVSIAVLDSCKSGAMTRAKGATLGPSYDIALIQDAEVEGRIVITSSSEDEISQESDKIEGSFFTHHWASGLYGAADANRDGIVTLEEAYRYAHFQTVEQTIESRGGVQHPSYKFALSGQGNVVMANLTKSTAEIQIHGDKEPGAYFLLDAKRQIVLTEIRQGDGGKTTIRVPPGSYRIRKRERARFLLADVTANSGVTTKIGDSDMRVVSYVTEGSKGPDSVSTLVSHGPRAAVGVRNGLISAMSASWEVSGAYVLSWKYLELGPRFVFRRAEIDRGTKRLRHQEFDFGVSGGWPISFSPFAVVIGLDVGVIFFDRKVVWTSAAVPGPGDLNPTSAPPEGAVALGFQSVGFAEIGYAVGSLRICARANGGLAAFSQNSKTKTKTVFGVALALAYALE
jgi:hypothetical protein